MKTIKNYNSHQFRNRQAIITNFFCKNEKGEEDYGHFTIFYSYTCPKIVIFPNGKCYQFTFENSRKAWEITSSHTTSKQCNKRLGENHHNLEKFNLWDFEKMYFDTRIKKYY